MLERSSNERFSDDGSLDSQIMAQIMRNARRFQSLFDLSASPPIFDAEGDPRLFLLN
jgi:hypothetical protein